jgi:hypothetical protein
MGNYLAMKSRSDRSADDNLHPVTIRHRGLERFANAALRVGRTLKECGASVSWRLPFGQRSKLAAGALRRPPS